MEIQALVTAPAAKSTTPKAVGETGADEFTACLEGAQAALESPGMPTEEVAPVADGELAAVAPTPTGDVRNLAPALMAQIQGIQPAAIAPEAGTFILPRGGTPQTIGQVSTPQLTQAPKTDVKPSLLPEPPGSMEMSVEVVQVEPFEVAKSPELGGGETFIAPTPSLETTEGGDEEAPEPDSDPAAGETAKIELKGEAKTETPLRAEGPVKAEGVKPETRLDTHNVIRELANRIELMAAAKSPQGVLVHLSPPDLGSITLLVKPESGGGVSAEMGASNDQVRKALQGSQQTLTRQLELRGVIVANVSVSAETSNYNPQRQGQQSAYSPRQFNQPSTFQAPGYGSHDPVARPSRLKTSGVDLWI